jgi:hypothetical protein
MLCRSLKGTARRITKLQTTYNRYMKNENV